MWVYCGVQHGKHGERDKQLFCLDGPSQNMFQLPRGEMIDDYRF